MRSEQKTGRLSINISAPTMIIAMVSTVVLLIVRSILSSLKLWLSFNFSIIQVVLKRNNLIVIIKNAITEKSPSQSNSRL